MKEIDDFKQENGGIISYTVKELLGGLHKKVDKIDEKVDKYANNIMKNRRYIDRNTVYLKVNNIILTGIIIGVTIKFVFF